MLFSLEKFIAADETALNLSKIPHTSCETSKPQSHFENSRVLKSIPKHKVSAADFYQDKMSIHVTRISKHN